MRHTLHYIRPRTAKMEGSWMIIFADLLALLMTFFVMLISMNTVQTEKWNSLVEAFSDAFNPARESVSIEDNKNIGGGQQNIKPTTISLDYLNAVFSEAVTPYENVLGVHVTRLNDRVVISLPSYFLFQNHVRDYANTASTPSLNNEGRVLINNLTSVMEQLANEVSIVGHVAPTYNGASPWIQSLKQASSVQETIYKAGYSGVISIYGLGNSRYDNIDKTIIPEVRLSIAGRVDIEVKEQLREALVDAS